MAVTSLGEFVASSVVAALSGSPSSSVPVGSVLVVSVITPTAAAPFTVTDSQGNTYTQVAQVGTADQVAAFVCATATALATTDTVTVTPSSGCRLAFAVDLLTGVAATLDGTAKTNTGTGTVVSTSASTVAAGSTVYLVASVTQAASTATPGTGFANEHFFLTTGGVSARQLTVVADVGASAGSITPQVTMDASSGWRALSFALASATTSSAVGTAALSLSASGYGGSVQASGSLQLAADATGGGKSVGSAAVALSAGGVGKIVGSASLSLVGSMTTKVTVTGTAHITLTGQAGAAVPTGPIIEADFAGTPFGGSPNFTDITADVLDPQSDRGAEVTGSWGRQDWFSQVSPSQMSLVLNNVTGKYTPGLTSSPYYPYVKYGTRIRYREVIGSTFVFIFDGYITDLTVTPENGTYWTTQVDATDILGRFATTSPLRSFLAEEMLLDNPNCLYALQEDQGALSFADMTRSLGVATAGNSSAGPGVVDAGQSPSNGFIAGNMVSITNDSYLTWNTRGTAASGSWISIPFVPTTATWSFEAWVQMPVAPPAAPLGDFAGDGTIAGFGAPLNTAGALSEFHIMADQQSVFASYLDNAGSAVLVSTPLTTPSKYLDGNVHQFVATIGSDRRTLSFYIDGALIGSSTAFQPLTAPPAYAASLLGMTASTADPTPQYPFSAAYAYVAYYPTALSSSRVAAHYAAGANAFQGERTDQHVSRLLSYRPNLGSLLDTGVAAVGNADVEGQDLQSALLDATQTEAGALYAGGTGRINFRARTRAISPSPVLTLDASLGQVDVPTTFRDDIQGVLNDVTVSRSGGADQRYVNTSHANTYGYYSNSLTANIDTDANAMTLAQFLVTLGTLDQLSTPTLTVDCFALLKRGYATLVAQVLQLRPMDVVHLTNLPFPAPATTMNVAVQGGSFTRSASTFSVELNALPAPP